MNQSSISEFGLIDKIKSIVNNQSIGDDCAVYKVGHKQLLLKVDCLIEGRHFLSSFPLQNLGWKAITVAVSDIVASGGLPKSVLISLVLPRRYQSLINPIYQSINDAGNYYGCTVDGGNISAGKSLEIHTFVVGETKHFITRRKAKVNDDVYLTAPVGMARAGLELLMSKKNKYESYEKSLINFQLKPIVNIKLSQILTKYANSSIDISDGLLADIDHISQLSQVKININPINLPANDNLKLYCDSYHKNILDYQLYSGEDYVIVFTADKNHRQALKDFYLIGQVEKGAGVLLNSQPVIIQGFDHFK